jgi:hypothetical protein
MQSRLNDVVPASNGASGKDIHERAHQPTEPQCPRQGDVTQNRPHSKREHQTANPRPSRANPIRHAPTFQKPWNPGQTDAKADKDSLGEIELPDETGEGGRDEATGLTDDAEGHGEMDSVAAG